MSYHDEATLNIGALSMATGVPVETIRTWERRYGFPASQRNEAGHRIYEIDTIEHLRLITAILAQGYRPSQLQGQSREELEELLLRTTGESPEASEDSSSADGAVDSDGEEQEWLDDWLGAAVELNREKLTCHLRRDYCRMDALAFLESRIAPFLDALGEGWATGKLSVLHEHFASECLRDFLTATWRPMSDMAQGKKVVLATLSGEQHSLGLHMAALVASLADRPILFLGSSAPVEAIAGAIEESDAETVGISVSRYANASTSKSILIQLRQLVGDEVKILVGGRGATFDVAGGTIVEDLQKFYEVLNSSG